MTNAGGMRMPPTLSSDDRRRFCQKLLELKEDSDQRGLRSPQMERYIGAVEMSESKHICDALADEKLLQELFRGNALRAEQLVVEQKLTPEGLAVIIYDSVTMHVDPWENVKLRGWEYGQPPPKKTVEQQPTDDELVEAIKNQLLRDRGIIKDP